MASGTTIRDQAIACINLFHDCVSDPGLRGFGWLDVGQADFNLWVSSLNVTSTGKASLDHRVRERQDVQGLIRNLLDGLARSLQDCLDHVSTTPSSNSIGTNFQSCLLSEMFRTLEFDIKTVLRELSRIHVAFRRAETKLRHQRADATLEHALETKVFRDWREEMQNLILMGIDDQNRTSWASTIPKSKILNPVQERLIHTNLLRRHRIEYATNSLTEAHKRALKHRHGETQQLLLATEDPSPDVTSSKSEKAFDEGVPNFTKDYVADLSQSKPLLAGTTETASEIESKAQGTATNLPFDFKVDPDASCKSATIITKGTQTGRNLDYPRWPKDAGAYGDVPCPYCAEPLSANYVRNEAQWRGHLAGDLTPYVCIVESCSTPDAMFVTTEELNRHVQHEHGVYRWVCDYCADDLQADEMMVFGTAQDWIYHVTETHFKDKSATQLEALSETAMRKMIEPISCPICDFCVFTLQPEIDEHIAKHMHAFALRALPWGVFDDQTKSSARDFAVNSELEDGIQFNEKEDLRRSLHDSFQIFKLLDNPALNGKLAQSAIDIMLKTLEFTNENWHLLYRGLTFLQGNKMVERVTPQILNLCCSVFQLTEMEKSVHGTYPLVFQKEISNELYSFIQDELNRLCDLLCLAPREESAAQTPQLLEDELAIPCSPNLTGQQTILKLSSQDFERCREPWSLSSIVQWLGTLVKEGQHLESQLFTDVLVSLFTYKVPAMMIANAEMLAVQVVNEILANGAVILEEGVLFSDIPISGVIYQLTGAGCYSSRAHTNEGLTRCYSCTCQRTLRKLNLLKQPELQLKDWMEFYNIQIENVLKYGKREFERQNLLHEISQKEERYLQDLFILQTMLRDGLANANAPVLGSKKLQSFIKDVFSKANAVKKEHEDTLLLQIKNRQAEQGPWLVGFSDIFREWIRKARLPYFEYATRYPIAIFMIRQEIQRNTLCQTLLENFQRDPRSRRLGYEHYLRLPIIHLQKISLHLQFVLRKSAPDNEEMHNLEKVIQEIKSVVLGCDNRVDISNQVVLAGRQSKPKIDPNSEKVELWLDQLE